MPPRLTLALVCAALVALLPPAAAVAAPTVVVPRLAGELEAAAFSGDAVVVARRPPGRRLVVERRAPNAAPVVLLRTRLDDDDDEVRLAASPQGLAVSLLAEDDDLPSSRVLVGPATGPLREVARCEVGSFLPPVAVAGTRIAWSDGGCLLPVDRPRTVGPAAVVTADADPAVAPRRTPLPAERQPTALALDGASAVVGLLRPALLTFFGGELLRVTADGLGPSLSGGAGEFVNPAGVLADGGVVTIRQPFFEETEDEDAGRTRCNADLATIAGDGRLRPLPLGRCLAADEDGDDESFFAPAGLDGVVVPTPERVVAKAFQRPRGRGEFGDREGSVDVLSARPDGGGRLRLASGTTYREPGPLIGGSGRAGWSEPRCGGETEIVAADPAAAAPGSGRIPTCRANLLTRSTRLRGDAVRLRLRCPRGCKGQVVDRTVCTGSTQRDFSFGPGTHSLRVRLSRAARRRGRALIELRAEHAPDSGRTVRLR